MRSAPIMAKGMGTRPTWRQLPNFPEAWQCGILRVIATSDGGWDHVSVSVKSRCPTWDEMEWVKRCFFFAEEACMQLHVPESDHINIHPYCLHIWRPHNLTIPRPPSYMVG